MLGLRSIGASLAAIVAAQTGGAALTLRPCGHPFRRELRPSATLKARLAAHAGAFAVVDEGPGPKTERSSRTWCAGRATPTSAGIRSAPKARPLVPVPTPESKRPTLRSVYAIGKYVQERMTLTAQYGMEGAALRLWNIYGPGQALSNPYTGVLAIFASRISDGHPRPRRATT